MQAGVPRRVAGGGALPERIVVGGAGVGVAELGVQVREGSIGAQCGALSPRHRCAPTSSSIASH